MWIRLTDEDAAEADADDALRRRGLTKPLLTAGIAAILLTALTAMGLRGGSIRNGIIITGEQRSLGDPALLVAFCLVFAATFALAWWRQHRTGQWLLGEPPSVICARCHQIGAEGAVSTCACGGQWEPIRRWTWVNDEGASGAEAAPSNGTSTPTPPSGGGGTPSRGQTR